jgi:DNA-binding NarL/FixJ family response regulator
MDAVCKAGENVLAAAQIYRSVKTLELHLQNARSKMQSGNRIQCLLVWDRWRRSQVMDVMRAQP